MRRTTIQVVVLAVLFPVIPGRLGAEGLESMGNTDGVLTWRLGTLEKDKPVREVVLFAFDSSPDAVARRLDEARCRFAQASAEPHPGSSGSAAKVWIDNGTTDFALEGPCFFRWRMQRQALRCAGGGQLSQFTWYVHYRDAKGQRRAGTEHVDASIPENLEIVEPVRAASATEAVGTLQTADKKLRIRVRATMGEGPVVAVEFVLTNLSAETLRDVCLSAYANLESAHTHEGDYSVLDQRTGGLLVFDPGTGMCAVMAGVNRPATGYSGVWFWRAQRGIGCGGRAPGRRGGGGPPRGVH
jgi:hypothetical protein